MIHPLISVIVPAYNAEDTIEKCIESILQQTIKCEIIVVDDGSTDNTLHICGKYKNFNNFVLLSERNSGVSAARNLGLINANGKYLGFVDSDDYINKDYFETLSKPLESKPSLCISINQINVDNKNVNNKKTLSYDHNKILKDILCSPHVGGYPWNKLFRRDIIERNKLRFREDIHDMEDKLFCIEYMNYSDGGCGNS